MRWSWQLASRAVVLGLALFCAPNVFSYLHAPAAAWGKPHATPPNVRWDEGQPGCTFSRDLDGKYRYGLWDGDIGITLAVDSQELEKVHRRHEPFLSLLLTVHYRGEGDLYVSNENISLEFLKHFQVVQTALDPESFSRRVQNDADALDHQTAREIEKHPEEKDVKETYVRAFQKDVSELLEFVSKNSLQTTHLNPGNREITGWVLFNTSNKWIGGWKKQEEFVLRVPLAGKIFEFPFKLPPKSGDLILRRRE